MTLAMLQLVAVTAAMAASPSGGQPATAPAALTSDWVLAGPSGSGRLRVTGNVAEVTLAGRASDSNDEDEPPRGERYRITGSLGAALTLEAVAAEKQPTGSEPSSPTSRARLLSISQTVALWWQPHRRAMFAYRQQSIPRAFQGRYTFDRGSEELRSVELAENTIELWRGDSEDDESINSTGKTPIVAVTDLGPDFLRVVFGRPAHNEALRIKLHGRNAAVMKEEPNLPDTRLKATFAPAGGAKSNSMPTAPTDSAKSKALPAMFGGYRLSSLNKNNEALASITVSDWAILPLGGSDGLAGPAEITGELSPSNARVTVRSDSFTLRRLDDEVSLLESDGEIFAMYRPDAPPPWAPPVGIADDVRLLCRELDAAAAGVDGRSVASAFERTKQGARSDVMRSIGEAISSMSPEYRAAALAQGLLDAGEPIPTCAGVEQLRARPGQR